MSETNLELPEGVQQALFVPLNMGGDLFWECEVKGFGHVAKGISRMKPRALSYALEALAGLVVQEK